MKTKEIKIPWDIGDKVYVKYGTEIRPASVLEIKIVFKRDGTFASVYTFSVYSIDDKLMQKKGVQYTAPQNYKYIFKTKKDAIFHWLEEQQVNPRDILSDFFNKN